MGQEATCQARFAGKTSQGKALLETDYVLFRGDFRVKIAFREMKTVKPRGEWLEIAWPEGTLALKLGAAAAGKWTNKILHPPSRLAKLGIKPGTRVSVIGVKDASLADEIAAAGATIGAKGEIVLYGAEKRSALAKLKTLAKAGAEAVWVVYPKGIREITEGEVIGAIRDAGLVDVKVASFSPTHTAHKAVARKTAPKAAAPKTVASRATFLKIGQELPGVVESKFWGSPALKIGGEMIAVIPTHKSAEPDSLAVRIDFDRRAELIEGAPEIFYLQPHYEDYPSVLVRMARITDDALRDLLKGAVRFVTANKSAAKRR